MTLILTTVTSVMTFIIGALGDVLDIIVQNPVLLLPLILAVVAMVLNWAKSFLHV